MKNPIFKMPEDTHSREAVGGSLWTGGVFGHFFHKPLKSLGGCHDSNSYHTRKQDEAALRAAGRI
jgi:hypothetical protein